MLYPCSIKGCDLPATRRMQPQTCSDCSSHFCFQHYQHECRSNEHQSAALLSRINLRQLEALAKEVRATGQECTITKSENDQALKDQVRQASGGYHANLKIEFEDKVKWLARINYVEGLAPPLVLTEAVVQREIATLKWLKANTRINIPEVYYADSSCMNPCQAPFSLIEYIEGSNGMIAMDDLTKIELENLVDFTAKMMLEIYRHPFQSIGSIIESPKGCLGPLADEYIADIDPISQRLNLPGPFYRAHDYRLKVIDTKLAQTLSGEINVNLQREAIYFYSFCRDYVLPEMSKFDGESEQFYLKHMDDKGDVRDTSLFT